MQVRLTLQRASCIVRISVGYTGLMQGEIVLKLGKAPHREGSGQTPAKPVQSEDDLVAAVQRVRLAEVEPLTVAQVHTALQREGIKAELSEVKKASSKAAKRTTCDPKAHSAGSLETLEVLANGGDERGDPRADPDKDYCLSEMTPEALRSLELGLTSAGSFAVMSAKDMMSSSMLMGRATQQLRKGVDPAAGPGAQDDNGDDGPGVYLWELTLKLRVCASDAGEFMTFGGLQKMARLCAARQVGGWDAVMQRTHDDFFQAVHFAMLAASALHECCRYRSGCEALARDPKALELLCQLPLAKIQRMSLKKAKVGSGYQPGMFEQAVADTVGRCINGLDSATELLERVKARLLTPPRLLLDGILSAEATVQAFADKFGHRTFVPRTMVEQCTNLQIDLRYLKLEKSHERLRTLLVGDDLRPWRSTFCMERHMMLAEGMLNAGLPDDRKMSANKICHWCLKEGRGAEAVKYCSRCKTACYCSEACQKAHWKTHKRECVEQKRSSAPGGLGGVV